MILKEQWNIFLQKVFPFHQRAVFMYLGLIGGLIIAVIMEPKKLT